MLLFAIPVDIPMLIAAARPTQPAWLNQNRLRRTAAISGRKWRK
jgi:hypothetical protein